MTGIGLLKSKFRMKLDHPKGKGEATEAAVVADLKCHGVGVLTPFGDNLRYDIAVDTGNSILKVQCKTGRLDDDVVKFQTNSSANHTNQGKKESYHGDANWFMVYCHELDDLYCVPVEETGSSSMSLRVSGEGAHNTNWASNYTLESFLSELD